MQSKCSQNCILIRTSSSKTNQCAPARRILCIPPQNQGKHSGTRFARPTSWLPKSRLVRLRCVYITTLEHFSERNEYERSPRATRLCAKHRAFQEWKVRGNAQCKCGLGFAKLFCGRRIRKAEANFFEKFFGLPPRRRVREECGAGFFFGGRA